MVGVNSSESFDVNDLKGMLDIEPLDNLEPNYKCSKIHTHVVF